jgi:hypothetical protein
MRFKSVISMTEEEREKYYADKRKEYIKPMLDKIAREDGTLDLEGLAYLLTDLTEEIEGFQEWRRS